MGNSFFKGKKSTKIMKINGETIKFKKPVKAGDVIKDYPGYVLLESESVKQNGIRSKPLELNQTLQPKMLYFLVELPKVELENNNIHRRVRSGINMSAKDRLESLKLSRRSVSDLSMMKPKNMMVDHDRGGFGMVNNRVKMRLPKAVVDKLMAESRDEAEAAQKIMDLCLGKTVNNIIDDESKGKEKQQVHWNGYKAYEKRRVSFRYHGDIQLAMAS